MSERKADIFDSQVSQHYEIRVRAYLDSSIADWLGDFTIHHPVDAETVLTGFLPDQSALFGILLRLHNLGIPLISVNLLPVPMTTYKQAKESPKFQKYRKNQKQMEEVK